MARLGGLAWLGKGRQRLFWRLKLFLLSRGGRGRGRVGEGGGGEGNRGEATKGTLRKGGPVGTIQAYSVCVLRTATEAKSKTNPTNIKQKQ